MSTPLIAIIDWAASPLDDSDAAVERAVVGDAARVKRFLCASDADFDEEICDADAIIVWHNTPITVAGLNRLRNCKAIIRNGVGFDSVDVDAARQLGIPVCNVPDYGTEEVADHAIALTLALCRQLFPLDAEAKRLGWVIRVQPKLRRLRELVFAVIGLGRIGTATALRAKALGFQVCFYDPYLPNGVDKAIGITRAKSLPELLAKADVQYLNCQYRVPQQNSFKAFKILPSSSSVYRELPPSRMRSSFVTFSSLSHRIWSCFFVRVKGQRDSASLS